MVAILVAPARADEIIDQINEAIKLYQAGDYAGAMTELDYASAQIRQLRAGTMSNVLPEPLAGWKADDAETTAMGSGMLGGITGASRNYRKDDARLSVSLVSDSPMLAMFGMMAANPMMMGGSGQQAVRVKGHRGVLEWQGDSGSLNLVVDGAVLVTVECSGCNKEDLVAYAEGVNYELLKTIMTR
jgi:hypothetical protein